MSYDNKLIHKKLLKWRGFMHKYQLPDWEEIPDLGLYMEQLIVLLQQYFDYLPKELKDEQVITAATINNYVRKQVMPEPVKKMYYRKHIAYLIVIITLKSSLSLALIKKVIPADIDDENVKQVYNSYVGMHRQAVLYFTEQMEYSAAKLLNEKVESKYAVDSVEQLIVMNSVLGGFMQLFSEKLLLLDDRLLEEYEDEEEK